MLLLIDDDPVFREEAKNSLTGYRDIFLARDGEQALRLVNALGSEFSIALVDLDLPIMDGFQLINELRKAVPDLPLIAISGVFHAQVLESAKEIGAVEVLSKPITPEWQGIVDRFRKQRPSVG